MIGLTLLTLLLNVLVLKRNENKMNELIKYPRTRHIIGSRKQHGDDLEDVPFSEIKGKHLVVEEKVDGSNCGISFDHHGNLLLQSRGHFLRGGPRERQFDLLKAWANVNIDMLFDIVSDRYIMYAEWLFAKHTCYYDALPNYFMEFDIYDKEQKFFLSEPKRNELLKGTNVQQVRVLHRGSVNSFDELKSMIGESAFISPGRLDALKNEVTVTMGPEYVDKVVSETDLSPLMEGLYIKHEEDGKVVGRYKLIRESFTSTIIDSETHWHDRPIIQNHVVPRLFP